MEHSGDWKQEFGKFKVVQRCPKCSKLTLKFSEGKLICSNCSFEQNVGGV